MNDRFYEGPKPFGPRNVVFRAEARFPAEETLGLPEAIMLIEIKWSANRNSWGCTAEIVDTEEYLGIDGGGHCYCKECGTPLQALAKIEAAAWNYSPWTRLTSPDRGPNENDPMWTTWSQAMTRCLLDLAGQVSRANIQVCRLSGGHEVDDKAEPNGQRDFADP